MSDLTERLIAMRDTFRRFGDPVRGSDLDTLAEAVNELVELEQARDDARAQRDVAQRNYLATNDAYARKAREHENELVRARAAEARLQRVREWAERKNGLSTGGRRAADEVLSLLERGQLSLESP